jgi:N-acetylmuramoyl-L-alanine amidase CwlA
MDDVFSLRKFERDLKTKKGGRNKATEIVRMAIDIEDDPNDVYLLEKNRRQNVLRELLSKNKETPSSLNPNAKPFIPSSYKLKSKKSSRKSTRKSMRKSRKSMRKSRKSSRKSVRKSRKSSRKSMRKSRKSSRKYVRKSRKSSRKSVRKSMGKRERSCKDLLKEKVGINIGEFENGRFSSKKQAIAVAYSQVKKMKPSCGKYFSRK